MSKEYNTCLFLNCGKRCVNNYCSLHNKPKCIFIDNDKKCECFAVKGKKYCKEHNLNKCNFLKKDGTVCGNKCEKEKCYDHSEKKRLARLKYRSKYLSFEPLAS